MSGDPDPTTGTDADGPPDAAGSGPDPLFRTVLIGGGALLVALAVTLVVVVALNRRVGPNPGIALFLGIKVLLTTFNVVLLVYLAGVYVNIYRELPNRFTLSLVLVTVALLLYALTSNPVLHFLLGFRGGGLGPFTFIPDLFASVAILVLLYQSYN